MHRTVLHQKGFGCLRKKFSLEIPDTVLILIESQEK